MRRDEVLKLFSGEIRSVLGKIELKFELLQEIRLRIHAPLAINYCDTEYFIGRDGALCGSVEQAYRVTSQDVKETMEYVSGYSLYAYEEEIRQGYLTIQGGHRVGIAGKTVVDGNKSEEY